MIGAKFVKRRLIVLLVLTALVSGCTAGRAFRKGRESARTGDWDTAVVHFTEALQASPDNAEYKIELERATQNAARDHITRAREFEQADQLDAALIEYKRAVELDPTNRLAASKAGELERTIRDRIEKSRPRPAIETMRQQARAQGVPVLNPADRTPLKINFNNSSLRDILNFIGTTTGINVQLDSTYVDKAYTVNLEGITLEEALHQILSVNGFFYKVLNPTTIVIAPDTPAGHQKYDDLVMQVFYLSHADVQEVSQTLNAMMRIQAQVAPAIYPNKTSNTIAVRATAAIVARRRTPDSRARSAARGSRHRGPDSRGQSQPRQAVRHQPERLCARLDVLARSGAAEYVRNDPADAATAVQPEHHLAGRQHVRLLPHGADGIPALPGDRFADEAAGQAAAARRGGH